MFDGLGIGVLMILMIISIVILVLQFSLVRMNQVRIEQDAFEVMKRKAMEASQGIALEHEQAIVNTLTYLSKKRIGASIIIERGSPLEDIEATGDSFGFGKLSEDLLKTIITEDGYMNRGAYLIRRDHVVAYNCRMPIVNNEQLVSMGAGRRHLGALGTVSENKNTVVAVVSSKGLISLFGYLGNEISIDMGLELKEYNLHEGVTTDQLAYRLHSLLTNENKDLGTPINELDVAQLTHVETKEERKERKLKEKSDRELQRKKEREEQQAARKREQLIDDAPKKKGLFKK